IVQVLAAVSFIAVYGLIAWKAFEGDISIGEVVLYFLALQRGYAYLQEFLGRMAGLYEDSLFLDNLFEFLNLKETLVPQTSTGAAPFPKPLRQGIEFKNVGFHYPSNQRWVLRNVDFSIKAGETVALVGVNGSGKSTIVKLINSLYQPVEGEVLVDGVSLSNIRSEERVANISVVFQDFILYNVTARENIWFGNAGTPPDESLIRKAAEQSGIHTIIEGFKEGYDTTLGTLFEGSEQMSPGQWQRLALARSFYNNAQIILLDEPTSSLDAFSEAKLLQYIRSVTRGRTSIIVSHRLSTIQMADKIIVLEGDKVVETGTYDGLLAKEDSHFSHMIRSLSDAGR
ncbi:MAG: ABC transporter ATP-binding protein/permease, partial [Bacteroidales bacterium]|nr:ABC transporter ATP-binding protein/permease [Bacteroidales bacterium]